MLGLRISVDDSPLARTHPMFRLGVIAAFLTCAVVGCRQYDVTMTDPDGNQVVTSSMNASLRDVTWLGIPIVLLILSLAAFLHWRRNGLWFLAILAFAAALMAVGLIAGRAGEWRMWGASMDDIASGHRRSDTVVNVNSAVARCLWLRPCSHRRTRGGSSRYPTQNVKRLLTWRLAYGDPPGLLRKVQALL